MQSKKEQLYVARLVKFIKTDRKGNQIQYEEYKRIKELLKYVSIKEAERLTARVESTIIRVDQSEDFAEYQHKSRLSSGYYKKHPDELTIYEDMRSGIEESKARKEAEAMGVDTEYVSLKDRMNSRNFNLGFIIGTIIITIVLLIVLF